MNEVTLRLLLDEARRGGLTLWLGADLPAMLTGLPSRQDLARGLAAYLGLAESQNLFSVARQAGHLHFLDVIRYVGEQLNTVGRSSQTIELLCAGLPIDRLITTCYDDRLEKAFQASGRKLHTLVSEVDVSLYRPNQTTLLKLYGDLRQPDSLIITTDHLLGLSRQKPSLIALVQQAMHGTLLLLGQDLHSPDFLQLWGELQQRLGRFAPVAYAAISNPITAADQQLWREHKIELLDHSALQILQTLALHLPQAANTPPLPAVRSIPEPPVQRYLDFDVAITQVERGLQVQLLRSPSGEATDLVPDLPAALPTLDQLDRLAGWDGTLGDWLLPGRVRERWAACLLIASAQQAGLRLRLFPTATAPLLPWEAALVNGKWLGLLPQTPIVRYVPANRPPDGLTLAGALRLLVVSSEADMLGLPPLAAQAEGAELTAALEPLQRTGKLQVEWLTGAVTRRALQDSLRRWQPQLLHYIGHGYFDEASRAGHTEGGLLLARTTATGAYEPDPISATELAVLFDGGALRFALLNACSTGRAAGGVAAALVESSLPAVVGMQANVPDGVAVTFAGAFYRALADGWPIEAAVAEGRRLLALEEGLEETAWAMPSLFERG